MSQREIDQVIFTPINGWTKASMLNHIIANFKGKSVAVKGKGPLGHHTEGCLYRGENGKKCAVGMFLKDEDYTVELEGSPIEDIAIDLALNSKFPLSITGMQELQCIHDRSDPKKTLNDMIKFIEKRVEDNA